MGISVNDKVVTFDGASNHLINNLASENPVVQPLGASLVYSIFRRVKSRDGNGDGNPLIYALKGLNGYSIDRENLLAFLPDFRAVLGKVEPYVAADHVISIPSSSNVSSMFARRVSRGTGGHLNTFSMVKKNHRKVCADLDLLLRADGIAKEDKRPLQAVRSELSRSLSSSFSMKLVPNKLRKYFSPFQILNPSSVPYGQSVLLVDDLLSSGTSLMSARDLLENHGVKDVKFLCLLSSTEHFRRLR